MLRKKPPQKAIRTGQSAPQKTTTKHRTLRAFQVGQGVPPIPQMVEELQDMLDVLLGRSPSPLPPGTLSLFEVADAYFARAMEMTMLLQASERDGIIIKGSAHYKFRVGELRTFCEIAKRSADLGSRRVTEEQLEMERQRLGRESI